MVLKLINIISLFLFLSCGVLLQKKQAKSIRYNYEKMATNDYVEHFSSLAKIYISSPEINEVKLPHSSIKYLARQYWKLLNNNELFFEQKYAPEFHIIKHQSPFYFSLPGGHIFFSSALIIKYFKNENVFLSALALEAIRTNKSLYKKRVVIPTGALNTEKMLSLAKLPVEKRIEINKWVFYAMKRSGFDPFALLIWIQTQNKNSLDFRLQQGDLRSVSREEFLLKSFIAKEGIINKNSRAASNSSKEFYKFTSFIKGKNNE